MTRANPLRCGMTEAELRAARAAAIAMLQPGGALTRDGVMHQEAGRLWRRNLRNARAALERELATLVFVHQARVRR